MPGYLRRVFSAVVDGLWVRLPTLWTGLPSGYGAEVILVNKGFSSSVGPCSCCHHDSSFAAYVPLFDCLMSSSWLGQYANSQKFIVFYYSKYKNIVNSYTIDILGVKYCQTSIHPIQFFSC